MAVNTSEEYRHQCEVRFLLGLAQTGGSEAFLAGVKKERGESNMKRLMNDAKAQWDAGNRGEHGDWRG